MKRLVVVGAGISGLAAAHAARGQSNGNLEILVLEKAASVGGKARTRKIDGWSVETGPLGFLGGEPALDGLVRDCGLADALVHADRAAANRYLVRGRRLRRVSPHPVLFARSGLLGPTGILRLLAEPLIGKSDEDDETVWSFAARRLGKQAADRLVAPMVLGIFAGDAKRLSLAAAFPRLAELERVHGSLFLGLVRGRRDSGATSPLAGGAGKLTSFSHGMHQITRQLARPQEGFTVRTGAAVESLSRRAEGGWQLRVAGDAESIPADAVVLAGEAFASADLLEETDAPSAGLLRGIRYPPVALVALGFPESVRQKIPPGFGVLIPREEGLSSLGILFDSEVFPGRSPNGGVLLRAFLGGAVDPDTAGADEETLVRTVRRDIQTLLGITEPPVFRHVVRWARAIPQYEIGHLSRVETIEARLSRQPGLFLAGNALHGIAFGKAAAAGVAAGRAAARRNADCTEV